MIKNYVETLKKNLQWVSTRWTEFWPKITVLTKNWPETHFSSRSTWLDPYWPGGLDFGRKWWFWPETAWNSFFTLVDMVWPILTWWTRFWSKMTVLTRNGMKLIFTLVDMVWPVLTRWTWFCWKDAVGSRKIYFWILNFFLIFLDFYK